VSNIVKPDAYIGVRAPREMVDQIRQIATLEGNGFSSVARRLLAAGLSRERQRQRHDFHSDSAAETGR
jgi:hypothetical protein